MIKMKLMKITILFFLIIISTSIFATSTTTAQNIAKEYLLENEFVDVSASNISCDDSDYYLVPVIDVKSNIVFYVPISAENGEVFKEKNQDNKIRSLFKSANLIFEVSKATSNNYLTTQLIDKIDSLKLVLESKNARLDGIIKSNYSSTITTKVKDTKNKLTALISQLEDLQTNLSKAQRDQSDFLGSPDCLKTDALILTYKDAFEGYQNLTKQALDYRDSINLIISEVVSNEELDENTKRVVLSYVESPTNLSSDISVITQSVSSTKSFYDPIVLELERSGENSKINEMLNNFRAREEYIVAKSLLYAYDSDLKTSLDQKIKNILSPEVVNFYKDLETVTKLSSNYEQINDLYSKGKYTEAIPKIKTAKTQVTKIVTEGFNYQQEEPMVIKYYFIIVGVSIVLLIILFINKDKIFKPKKKKPKTISLEKKEVNSLDSLMERNDPFK